MVLFKFSSQIPAKKIREIEEAFAALPGKIAAIEDFEWGTDISVENKQMGFTHCFLLSFKSEDDRNAYIPHPAHKAFGEILHPWLDKVCVVDYWAR